MKIEDSIKIEPNLYEERRRRRKPTVQIEVSGPGDLTELHQDIRDYAEKRLEKFEAESSMKDDTGCDKQ